MINSRRHGRTYREEPTALLASRNSEPAGYQFAEGYNEHFYINASAQNYLLSQVPPFTSPLQGTQAEQENYRLNKESKTAYRARLRRLSALFKTFLSINSFNNARGDKGKIQDQSKLFLDLAELSSAETITATSDLIARFEGSIKKYTKISKEEDKVPNSISLGKLEVTKIDEPTEEERLILQRFVGQAPLEILTEAKLSSGVSKALVKYVQSIKGEQLEAIAKAVNADLQAFIENENTCYLVKTLVKLSDSTMKKVYNFCVHKFDEMLHKIHTCRLVYTTCNHSERFRHLLQINFKSRMMKLLSTLSGANLLSLLICNSKELKDFDFIIEELQKAPEIVKNPFFSRALVTYMNKCSMDSLAVIATVLSKNLPFLLQDNHGNYLLQIFYDRDCKSGVELCNIVIKKLYKKAFIRRYSRFVLLKALQHSVGSRLAEDLLYLVLNDSYTLQNIVLKGFSQELLLLTFAKVEDKKTLLKFIDEFIHWQPNRNLITAENSSMYQVLTRDLAVLKKYAQTE